MARKAVLEGGKREEILMAAMELFWEHGYEATSVRMILNKVGGEVGMFYHYFQSKDALFQAVVERFFADYRIQFQHIDKECQTKEGFIHRFLSHYEDGIKTFYALSGNMHWTIQYAMNARTLAEMKPTVVDLVARWSKRQDISADILAGQLLYGFSATLHADTFPALSEEEKFRVLLDLINRLL